MLAQHIQLTSGPSCWSKHSRPHAVDNLLFTSLVGSRRLVQKPLRHGEEKTGVLQEQYLSRYHHIDSRVRALIDTEVSQADSWSVDARAAVLGTTWQKFEAILVDLPQLATCDPSCKPSAPSTTCMWRVDMP